jgi:hypothetical protein
MEIEGLGDLIAKSIGVFVDLQPIIKKKIVTKYRFFMFAKLNINFS